MRNPIKRLAAWILRDDIESMAIDRLTTIKELHIEDGTFDVTMKAEWIQWIGELLYRLFVEFGGINYVSWTVQPKDGDCGPLELTLRKTWGKTPAVVAGELREENARLRAEIAAIKERP